MGDMAPRTNNTKSRYLVELDPVLGHVTVTPRYEDAMTAAEVIWLRAIIALSLKVESINTPRSNTIDDEKRAQEPDRIVHFLSEQHRMRRIPMRQMSKAMGLHQSTLSSFNKGNTRAYLDVARPWAYMLGFDLIPIPVALRNVVWDLVNKHCTDVGMDLNLHEVITLTEEQHAALAALAGEGESMNRALDRLLGIIPQETGGDDDAGQGEGAAENDGPE